MATDKKWTDHKLQSIRLYNQIKDLLKRRQHFGSNGSVTILPAARVSLLLSAMLTVLYELSS